MMAPNPINIVSGLLLRTWSATLFLSLFLLNTGRAQEGIFLSLRGTPIDNNGFVDVNTIDGHGNDNGLLCLTNSTTCCSGGNLNGDWYYPGGIRVGSFSERNVNNAVNFFYRNRGASVVRLNRRGIPSERGKFYCELINNDTVNQTISVNILDIGSVMISPSGSITVTTGEAINLQCSVNITTVAMSDTPVFEWFRGSTLLSSSTTVSGNTYISVLQIPSASASDAGTYTCRLRGNQITAVTTMVTVQMPTSPPTTPPPTTSTTSQSTPSTTSPDTQGTTAPPPPVSISVAPITTTGPNTAGEIYNLSCSVSVTGSTEQPTITWLDPMNNQITSTPRIQVIKTGSRSTLSFEPLAASDAGTTYTCRATLGSAMDSESSTITVQDPTITVRIVPNVDTPMLESIYSLICAVTGAGGLINNGATVGYQWFKHGAVVPGQTMDILSFNPLTFSDVGAYTCQATVTSSLLSTASITTSMANPVSIRLTLPAPTVILRSDTTGSTISAGSTVTLTCTVAMQSSVRETDLTVLTVDTRLSMLGGESRVLTDPTVTNRVVVYMTQLSSFGRSDSGNYSCTATVRPQPQLSSYLTAASPVTSNSLQLISDNIGVYLSLRGRIHVTINSYVDIDGIGEGENDGALLCITDLMRCCSRSETGGGALGRWLYPNGTDVGIQASGDDFYRNRGPSVVHLNRRNNAVSPTGLYCCEVPDATNSIQRVCANVVLEVPTTPGPATTTASQTPTTPSSSEPASFTTPPETPTTPTTGGSCPSSACEQLLSAPCTCSNEIGIAVGALLLVEGIIAGVITIIVVSCWIVMRQRKSGKSDFAVSTNMAYGQVKLDTLGDIGGEYEDPDRLARSRQSGGGNYEPTGHPAPYELPVGKPEAPVYATADETTNSGKTPK